jgi:hypothetical protein
MRQFVVAAIASTGLLGFLAVESAQAQVGAPPINQYNQQILSPYLPLTQRGATGAQNYINLVAPQLATNGQVGLLQQQVALNQQAIQQQPQQFLLLTTGHPTTFLNYRRYFMNNAAVAGAGTTTGGFVAPGGTSFGTGQGIGYGGAGFGGPRSGVGGPGAFAPSGTGRPNLPY